MEPGTLKAAQRQDRAAQRALLGEVGPLLAALVRRLGLPGSREDQLQGLFAHVLEVLPKFEPSGPAKLTTWLHTVATRWLLMERRKHAPPTVGLDDEEAAGVPSPTPGAEELVEGRSLEAALERALEHLPGPQRRAFVLLQLEQQSLAFVADLEGVPVGTLKSRLHRARAALALELGALLDRPGGTP